MLGLIREACQIKNFLAFDGIKEYIVQCMHCILSEIIFQDTANKIIL